MINSTIKHLKKLDQGKQGITGLAEVDGIIRVYKISQYMNYLTNHEFLILSGLSKLCDVCPHFCSFCELRKVAIHPNFKQSPQNPFEPHSNPIFMDVFFMEYIQDSIPLFDLIKEPSIPYSHLMSCVKQILMAITIAQREKHFAHYDLHSLNILVRDVPIHTVYLYILDETNAFYIPSYGYNPVIIDYGFSYSSDIEQNPSYISLAYTDSGYMSPAFDPLADPKVFLVSLAEDFKECRRKSTQAIKFRNIVKNIFAPLNIKWTSGWDKSDELSIVDRLFRYIANLHEPSKLFRHYSHMCMDILQSLIQLPFSSKIKGSLNELERTYKLLVSQFEPIETEINDAFYSLYAFRRLIDIARELRPSWIAQPSLRAKLAIHFRNEFISEINKSLSFCAFKHVDFELVLCSLFAFTEQLEFQLQRLLSALMAKKGKQYSQLSVQRIEHIYTIFDLNFQDNEFVFDESTVIRVCDLHRKQTLQMTFDDPESSFLLTKINTLPYYNRANYLAQLYLENAQL